MMYSFYMLMSKVRGGDSLVELLDIAIGVLINVIAYFVCKYLDQKH